MKPIDFFIAFLIIGTSVTAQEKLWKLSTTAEYSSGSFDRVTMTSVADGALQLNHPLQQHGHDTLDGTALHFVDYDDAGNYVQASIASKRVIVQKFNAQRQSMSPAIVVDENARVYNSEAGVALLNDGSFCVGWAEMDNPTGNVLRYGQFFNAANEKVGANVRIFSASNSTGSIPHPIADRVNRRFLFLSPERTASNNYQSFGWMFSPSGMKLHDSIKIVPSSVTLNEFEVNGTCRNGVYAFVWSGTNGNTGPNETYFMLADSNCHPTTTPVIANNGAPNGSSPEAAIDDAGNCCAAWGWNPGVIPGSPGIVYAQMFDRNGMRIGGVLRLTDIHSGGLYWKKISSVNGIFRVAYGVGSYDGQQAVSWSAMWRMTSILSGTFVSGVFDAGSQQTTYRRLFWNCSVPQGTRLRMQLRSASAPGALPSPSWSGPGSDTEYYAGSNGELVNTTTNGKRYLQLKAIFNSDVNGTSPVLYDVNLTYVSGDTIGPAPVPAAAAHGEHRRVVVEWGKSPSADVLAYRIYRAVADGMFDQRSFVQVAGTIGTYADSTVSFDTTYRYGITALDSTFNESAMTNTAACSPRILKIFVAASASAAGDGSSSKPVARINDGIRLSDRGDTVYVLPGEYTEDIVMKAGVSLIGAGAPVTKILSSNSAGAVKAASYTLIKGFTFAVAGGIAGSASHVTITENIFLHQGSGFDVAIFAGDSEQVVITKNILLNFAIGIQAVASYKLPVTPVLIRNNIISCSMNGVSNVRNRADILNNTIIVAGTGTGVSLSNGTTRITNNCFACFPSEGSYSRSVMKAMEFTLQMEYNNRWNFPGDERNDSTGSMFVDPLFVNAAKFNYHPSGNSPCLNAGNPSTMYNDADGSRNDIGAYGGPDPMPAWMTFSAPTDISLTGGTGFPADTVSVEIVLSHAAGVKQADLAVRFDPRAATFIDAVITPLTKGFSISATGTQPGLRSIHLEGSAEISAGSGSIASCRFLLDASASGGLQSAVELAGATLLDAGRNRVLLSTIASGLLVVKSRAGFPHRIYVDGNYTGVSNGSVVQPFTTVQRGIDSAKAHDTVMVAAGMYAGPIVMKSDVYVQGAGAAVTTIKCAATPLLMSAVVRFLNVRHAGIAGCTLVNESSISSVVDVSGSEAEIAMNKIDEAGMGISTLDVHSGSTVTIRDNYFIESKYGGVYVINFSGESALISGNTFSPSSAQQVIVLHDNARATIVNNRFNFTPNQSCGIFGHASKRSVVANNFFIGNGSNCQALQLADAESTSVVNNVFDMVRSGVNENNGAQVILNNVFVGGKIAVSAGASTVHRYNVYWKNSTTINNGTLDGTEIAGDPQFVDYAKGDYRLSAQSILRNAGDPGLQWNDNDGTRNDIGVFGGPFADASVVQASSMRLRLGSGSGAAGDTVTIPVIAAGMVGMAGVQLMIEFDASRLQLLNVRTVAATRSFSIVQKFIGASLVTVELSGSSAIVVDSAAIAELRLLILPEATGSAFVKLQNVSVLCGAAQMVAVQNMENGSIDLTLLAVDEKREHIPDVFALAQNYPNPFNPSTAIVYHLPASTRVSLKVYNMLGQEITTLVDGVQKHGSHTVTWDASRSPSGMYIYRLLTNGFVQAKKMLLVK